MDVSASRPVSGHDIATCALIVLYVNDDTSPFLESIMTYAARLIFETDAQAQDLATFLSLFEAHLIAEMTPSDEGYEDSLQAVSKLVQSVKDLCHKAAQLSGLRGVFSQLGSLLMHDDVYDEDKNIAVKAPARQIDDASPFGHFLLNCIESYMALQDDEIAPLLANLQRWCVGTLQSTQTTTDQIENEQDADTLVDQALRRGDYSAARAVLEGSFSQPPACSSGMSLASTLLRNAQFHLRTLAIDKAKEALDEALRLARGANETSVISACDDLDQKIKLHPRRLDREIPAAQGTARKQDPIVAKDVEEVLVSIEEGASLTKALNCLDRLFAQAQAGSEGHRIPQAHRAANLCEILALETDIWTQIGSPCNALIAMQARQDLLLDVNDQALPRPRLAIAISQATHLSQSGRIQEAIALLTERELLSTLDVDLLQTWRSATMSVLYTATSRCGLEASAEKIAMLVPEICRGRQKRTDPMREHKETQSVQPNEATLGRSFEATHEEYLRGRLEFSRELLTSRNSTPAALTTAAQTRDMAEQSACFSLVRLASCEAAQALMQMDMIPQASDALDEVMPNVMASHDAEARASICLAYAKLMIKTADAGQDRVAQLEEARQWLYKAMQPCAEASLDPLRRDILYFEARVHDALGQTLQRDEAARQCLELDKELRKRAQEITATLDDIQKIGTLAGARIVAGA